MFSIVLWHNNWNIRMIILRIKILMSCSILDFFKGVWYFTEYRQTVFLSAFVGIVSFHRLLNLKLLVMVIF